MAYPPFSLGKSRFDQTQYSGRLRHLLDITDPRTLFTSKAMVLGVIAEHSLPMTMAPVLINLAKELSKDKKVLDDLSMDRTSASYKMTYGLSKTIHQETVRHLQTTPFSLNIDETTTSANNKHIVTVLVNYFNAQENKVVLEQLASRELIRVNAESLFEFLDELFEQNEIPWANLVSILMDSCSVMRGCKNGLEVRVRREKAPHLLDIDGDLCHHMHNGCKKFCEPFESWVEKLFNHLHVDFKYSTDLREALSEICTILNIKFTVPERFLNHRWLSAYDVSVSTLRLWDAYKVFYYSFIETHTKSSYFPVVSDIMKKYEVDEPGKARIKEIICTLRKKKMTVDGKNRKKAIVEKIMFQDEKTLLNLHFYIAVLPILKNYVEQFQAKEPLIHLLYQKQAGLKECVDLLDDFKNNRLPEGVTNKQLWEAQKVKQSIIHPDTGKEIFMPFRMSGYVPFGSPIVVGMLLPGLTFNQMIFWQWLNQTHNACFNYSNRNATKPTPTTKFVMGYLGAVTSAVSIAVGLSKLIQKANKFSPATKMLIQRFVPFPAVASANICNVLLMRNNELTEGIDVMDKNHNVVGTSKIAARKAVLSTAGTRVILPAPILIIPPIIMSLLEKTRFLKKNPRWHIVFNAVACTLSFGLALPATIALFPQYAMVSTKELEPEIQSATSEDMLIFNKGL